MRRAGLLALAVLALAACQPRLGPAQVTERSDAVITTVIERIYPGLSVDPTRACVRANATPEELRMLARSADFVGGAAQAKVLEIIDRPETDACLRSVGIRLG